VQFAERDPDLVPSNLFALGLEFLIQQPVPGSGVVPRSLAHLLAERVTILPLGTTRWRVVLMVP